MPEMDVSISGFFGLVLTCSIIIAIPGPSIMFFIGQVLTVGKKHALYAVMGNAIGMFSIAMLLSLGLGSLILKSDLILSIIRILGALTLLYMGLRYLCTDRLKAVTAAASTENEQSVQRNPLTAGIIVGVTNPKAFIMFGTIVPSFLSVNTINPADVLMLYSMVPILLGLIIDFLWVLVAYSISSRVISNTNSIKIIHRIGGTLIIMMALLLIIEVATDVIH